MYFLRILTRVTEEQHFNPSRPEPRQWDKFTYIFIFTFLLGGSKGLMKTFIKAFETPQKSVKKKFK